MTKSLQNKAMRLTLRLLQTVRMSIFQALWRGEDGEDCAAQASAQPFEIDKMVMGMTPFHTRCHDATFDAWTRSVNVPIPSVGCSGRAYYL